MREGLKSSTRHSHVPTLAVSMSTDDFEDIHIIGIERIVYDQ
jgi:hypothetical protein